MYSWRINLSAIWNWTTYFPFLLTLWKQWNMRRERISGKVCSTKLNSRNQISEENRQQLNFCATWSSNVIFLISFPYSLKSSYFQETIANYLIWHFSNQSFTHTNILLSLRRLSFYGKTSFGPGWINGEGLNSYNNYMHISNKVFYLPATLTQISHYYLSASWKK